MYNNQLNEESQIINQQLQSSQIRFRSIKSINEEDEIQQINNSHFQNLSSSSLQFLSQQESINSQDKQNDHNNYVIQDKQKKNYIVNQQNEQKISFYSNDQIGKDIVQNESNINEIQVIQYQQHIKCDNKNNSQMNNYSENKDIKQIQFNLLINQNINNNAENIQNSIGIPKSILKSPKSKSGDHSLNKTIFNQDQILKQIQDHQQFNQIIESKLNQIFLFYTKQFQQTPIKQKTKDQILQKTQVLNLQQFLHFCKDFQLIDLLITNEFIQQYAGHNNQKPLYKIKYKNRVGGSFVITKSILEDIFNKCSYTQQLSFQEFLYTLIKIADIAFPVSNSLQAFYQYIGIYDPEIYSKKLKNIQDTNISTIQNQKNIQNEQKLRFILPQKFNQTKSSDHRNKNLQPITKSNQIQEIQKNYKILSNKNQVQIVRFEDLETRNQDFDPSKLLLKEDLRDQEDELYLRDYMINKQGITMKYQDKQRIQYPNKIQQSIITKGQTEQIQLKQNVKLNKISQQHNITLQKILEMGKGQKINYNKNQKTQKLLQKQKNQFIHPNSFELRKNNNIVQQLPVLNNSHIITNINSFIEREQDDNLLGIVKNQYHSIKKIFRK